MTPSTGGPYIRYGQTTHTTNVVTIDLAPSKLMLVTHTHTVYTAHCTLWR